MAEAVAGLSLAANILQMVEYGAVFVTTAWKIYTAQSDIDIVKDFKHLQYLTKDVDKVLVSLKQDASAASPMPGEDPELASLAQECRKITTEILEFVGKAGDQKSWKTRTHKAVKEAFKLTWDQGKLHKLQTNLDRMRHISAESSEKQEVALNQIIEEMKLFNYKIDQALEVGLGTASVDLISLKLDAKLGGNMFADMKQSLRSNVLGVVSGPLRPIEGAESSELRTVEVSPSRRQALKQKLLEKLSYPDMLSRQESVARASETTFRWIFEREKHPDRPWASFWEWLEAPDKQLYWITGKPGSGKSTLMKFISQPPGDEVGIEPRNQASEPRCLAFLKSWAGDHPLIVASYYFWAIGSPMQKSKEGMLRSLLHGILSQADSEVIATIMPELWEALHLFDEDPKVYTEDSLKILLSRAFDCMCTSTKISLFIDGLDEFDGEHEDLVLYLRDALKAHPIKLCVSSRQWQVFEDAFHGTSSLRLQDLTLPDMMEYVRSELFAGPAFSQLRERDPAFSDKLNETVALRADGVFLWVALVVKSLRKGIAAGDRISDLQIRLDQLPQDLEALYERILDELNPEHLDDAIKYFKLMEARLGIGMPNVMVLSYADEEDEMFGITCPILPLDWKTFESRRNHLKRRLNSRCMGLLEITEPMQSPTPDENAFNHASESHVNYLHKTVGEYIARDEVRQRLNRGAGRGFDRDDDLHLQHCSSELAFAKSSPSLALRRSRRGDDVDRAHVKELKSPITNCLRHAAQVEKHNLQSMNRLVEEFEKLYTVGNFRSLIIDCGVVEYIRTKAHRRDSVFALKFWLKHYSTKRAHRWLSKRDMDLWSEIDWQLVLAAGSRFPNPAIVELLLERGANFQYMDTLLQESAWQRSLTNYMFTWFEKSQEREERQQIVALMIKHGAPIQTKVIVQAYQQMARKIDAGLAERDDAFCSNIENRLKVMKQDLK